MTATNVPTEATCLCGTALTLDPTFPPAYRDATGATTCDASADHVHVPTERKCAVDWCTSEVESDDRVLCDNHRDRAPALDPNYDPYDHDA